LDAEQVKPTVARMQRFKYQGDGSTPVPFQGGYNYGYGQGPCWAR